MNKYKINIIYANNKPINEIFINVLNKDLKKFLKTTYNGLKDDLTSTCAYLSLKDKGDKINVT